MLRYYFWMWSVCFAALGLINLKYLRRSDHKKAEIIFSAVLLALGLMIFLASFKVG